MAVGSDDTVKLIGVQVYGDCLDGVFHGVYLPSYEKFLTEKIV